MLEPDLHEALDTLLPAAGAVGGKTRYLICHPPSTVGTRFYTSPPAVQAALGAFHERLIALLGVLGATRSSAQYTSCHHSERHGCRLESLGA
jgi:hypothetical protein